MVVIIEIHASSSISSGGGSGGGFDSEIHASVIYFTTFQCTQDDTNFVSDCKSLCECSRLLFISTIGIMIFQFLEYILSFSCFAYYISKGCDPLLNKDITNPNQVWKLHKCSEVQYTWNTDRSIIKISIVSGCTDNTKTICK